LRLSEACIANGEVIITDGPYAEAKEHKQ